MNRIIWERFKKKVPELMQEHNVKSQRQFAISIGFTPQYLGNALGTVRPPSDGMLAAISKVYGLPEGYWVGENRLNINIKNAVTVKMPDAGMTPTINVNDTIIYSTTPSAVPAPGVYVLEVNGHKNVRRVRPSTAGNVLIVHDNKEYEDYEIAAGAAVWWRVEKIVTSRGL